MFLFFWFFYFVFVCDKGLAKVKDEATARRTLLQNLENEEKLEKRFVAAKALWETRFTIHRQENENLLRNFVGSLWVQLILSPLLSPLLLQSSKTNHLKQEDVSNDHVIYTNKTKLAQWLETNHGVNLFSRPIWWTFGIPQGGTLGYHNGYRVRYRALSTTYIDARSFGLFCFCFCFWSFVCFVLVIVFCFCFCFLFSFCFFSFFFFLFVCFCLFCFSFCFVLFAFCFCLCFCFCFCFRLLFLFFVLFLFLFLCGSLALFSLLCSCFRCVSRNTRLLLWVDQLSP